jgi:hypothetical protein
MYSEALEMAEMLDKEFEVTGQIRGSLHGVPVSLKDQINVAGFDSTIGMTGSVDLVAYFLLSLSVLIMLYFLGFATTRRQRMLRW